MGQGRRGNGKFKKDRERRDITTLLKLRGRLPSDHEAQDDCSVEEARCRFNWGRDSFRVVVEGQHVRSFEQLRDLAGQDRFKDRKFIEVEVPPRLAGRQEFTPSTDTTIP